MSLPNSPRNLPAEVAHLTAWWATHALLTRAAVGVAAGLSRNTLTQALRTGAINAALLDAVYPTLAAYGYEPLSNAYLFL